MAQKFVGIDLGNRKVKIAVIASGLRGAQLLHVWEQAIEVDQTEGDPVDPAVDVALRMLAERNLIGLPTGIALPGGAGSYRVLGFPFDDPRQIAQAIEFEIEGQFPLPIEELAIDHLAVKRGDGRGRALVVAAKRTTLEHVVARLQLADVDVRLVTTGALAIAQALATTPVPPLPAGSDPAMQPVTLVLDIGDKNTELVALGGEGPVAVRSMRRGGRQLVRALKKTWKLDAQAALATLIREGSVDDPAVRRALQPLLREVEHTRAWLRSDVGCQVVEIRLAGGAAMLRGIGPWLAGETGLEVAPVQPRETGALKGVQGRDWSGSLVALGTAVAAGRRPLIQLHDAYDTGGGEGQWFQQHFSTVAALAIAILAFAAVDSMVRVKSAERERDAYAAELEHESALAFGQSLTTASAVRAKLSVADTRDMDNHVPERGALEVLDLLTKAALPKGGRTPPPDNGLPPGYTWGTGPDGQPAIVGPDGQPVPLDPAGMPMLPDPTNPAMQPPEGDTDGEAQPVRLAPVADRNAGVLYDDDLQFSSVEIRELKMVLNMSATRVTAQDRFAVNLERFSCVNGVTKGATRDRNDRKNFEMTIDHNCYTGAIGRQGVADDEDDAAEDGATPAAGADGTATGVPGDSSTTFPGGDTASGMPTSGVPSTASPSGGPPTTGSPTAPSSGSPTAPPPTSSAPDPGVAQ